jgi:hypothetical protein
MKRQLLLKNLGKVANIISAILMVASVATNFVPVQPALAANPGAIWTNTTTCGSPGVDINHFAIGDLIYIHGSGFDASTSYAWAITGQPGGASGDPNIDVASGNFLTDSSGAFCFDAYTVQPDDWGEYSVKFGNKGDNYQVDDAPSLSLQKSASPTTYDLVGTVITYSYLVTNTGNVTIQGPITITDDKATVTCPSGDLAAGATMACTATYTIIQSDMDNGFVTNTATACGTYKRDAVCSNQDQATVTEEIIPGISITKTADPTSYSNIGDIISYSYDVTNTGNVTLSNVTVTDDKATVTCPPGDLAPGDTITCTATYVITSTDITNGSVVNTAYATGDYDDGESIQSDNVQATVILFVPLSLAAFCAADPTLNNAWQVVNTNTYPVDYEIVNGDGLYSFTSGTPVPASGSASFDTPISAGSLMKLYVSGILQDSTTAATGCLPPPPPPGGPGTPFIPVTGVTPPSGGEPTILIPVTGVDLSALSHSLPGDLFSLSLGFFGLGLVFTGLSRKQEDEE